MNLNATVVILNATVIILNATVIFLNAVVICVNPRLCNLMIRMENPTTRLTTFIPCLAGFINTRMGTEMINVGRKANGHHTGESMSPS